MNTWSDITRELISWAAANYPNSPFQSRDIPKDLRRGSIGCIRKSYLVVIARNGDQKTFRITDEGASYARKYTPDLMSKWGSPRNLEVST